MFVFDIEANSKNVKMDIKRILARVDFEIKTWNTLFYMLVFRSTSFEIVH